MKNILTIGLLLSVVCGFVVHDAAADPPDGHAWADMTNARDELARHQTLIDKYKRERDRYSAFAWTLIGMDNGALGSPQTAVISSLSIADQATLANTLGLPLRTFLAMYGSTSLKDAADTAISNANSYHGAAQYLYNNPTRLHGFDAANSAIEAWQKAGQAVDHHDAEHSEHSGRPAPNEPRGPGNINLPKFECPGPCTTTYNTLSEAESHLRKCGTAEPVVLPFLSTMQKRVILTARSVSEGCGESYYSCASDAEWHSVRTCQKGVWKTRLINYTNSSERYRAHTCGDLFRRCMWHGDYHGSSALKTAHSDTDPCLQKSPRKH